MRQEQRGVWTRNSQRLSKPISVKIERRSRDRTIKGKDAATAVHIQLGVSTENREEHRLVESSPCLSGGAVNCRVRIDAEGLVQHRGEQAE